MPVILSWNVQGRVRGVAEQAAALAEHPADVVCLQEIRRSALDAWRTELAGLGYTDVRASHDVVDVPEPVPLDRRLGVLVAARSALEPAPSPELPWPERHLAAVAAGLEVHCLHAPISPKRDRLKVRTLEAMVTHLAAPSPRPRVLVGDLNTPRYESREGVVSSFARTQSGRLKPELGERHDAAELSIVPGLADHGYADAFRAVHGYARRDRSWLYPHGKMGYRIDHAFARGVAVEDCDYVHAWRERGLSDHSALWVRVAPG